MKENWIDDIELEKPDFDRWNTSIYDYYNDTFRYNQDHVGVYRDLYDDLNESLYMYVDYGDRAMNEDDILSNADEINRVHRCFNWRETYTNEELLNYVESGGYSQDVKNIEGIMHNKNFIDIRTMLPSEYDRRLYEVHKDNISRFGQYNKIDEGMLFICNRCGRLFYKIARNMISGSGCECDKYVYKGEELIKNILNKLNIEYKEQYSDSCINPKTKRRLLYDFVLPNFGDTLYIEIQGKQHYEPVKYFGGEEVYKDQIKRDEIKRSHAEENGIFIELDYREHNLDKLKSRFEELVLPRLNNIGGLE